MAIKIIKDASGSNIKFEGIDRKPIPVNAYLSAITVGDGGITIFNPDSPLSDGSPSKVMHNVPYTEFVKADGSVPASAEDLKADIDVQLIQAAPTDVNIGYKGHWDAITNTPDLTGTFENGDWFYVGVAGTYESVDYNINDIIKYNGTSFDLISDPNLRIDAIEGSAINAYDIVVDADYLGSIKTGSALQPYTDLLVAIANSSANDSILVKGINIITAEIVLPHALSFYGANNAEIKYANYDVTNGDIFSFTGTNAEEFNFEHIVFKNAGGYGLLLKQTEEINIRNCEFFNNGWDGTQLNTVLDSVTSGLLGYDSTNTELQAFYAGSHASNGGALRIEECRKLMIRESRAEGNLRGFRVQDCGINGGGFLIENQSIGNIESGIYLAAGSLGGSQNITVAINYSAYNANNGLLCIGGINNKFSQNEVNGNWNAGLCAWGSVNLTLRDCGLYDNNRSQYNGIGNTGDAKASIQINDAYSFIPYQLTYNPAMRFIAEILDTQVHYTGLGSNTDKVGFLMTSGMGSIPDNSKNIIKIDDVGFIGQDYAIDLSEVDISNLRLSLGDNSYQSIGQKAVKTPLSGNYSELPFSNHVMHVPEVDVVVDTLKQTISLHEGVGGNVINVYSINELQSVLKANSVDIIQKSSDKIQLRDCTLGNVYINGVVAGSNVNTMNDSLNAAFNMDLVEYKEFIESEVGVEGSEDFATFYLIETPDDNFEYPLFKTQAEAEAFSTANGGSGYNTKTYEDDLTNTTWYVPTVLFVDNGTSAPVNGIYGTSTNVIWNIQPTDDDTNYLPTFNSITYNVQEGSNINIPYKPAGDTATYNITNIPTGYADDGFSIIGTAEDITNGYGQAIQHVINVTKANSFGSVQGTITINVKADLAGNEFTIVDQGGAIKFTQDGGATVLDFNTVTFNAGSTYKFYVDGATMQTNDVFDIVDANGNAVTGNDGLSMTGGSGPGYAGTYFQYVIPTDVEPGKFLTFTDGATSTTYTDVPLIIAGSTYTVDITGIDLEGPSANQTGTNIADNGGYGWLSIDEPLGAGQRFVMNNAFFTELLAEMGDQYEIRIGLKGDNWDNGDQSTKSNTTILDEVFKGNLQLRINKTSSNNIYMQIFHSGSGGSNSMFMNTVAQHNTACAFIEITSSGNNIRMGFGRNGATIAQGDESTVLWSDWIAYKGQTGNQGFGITSLDVMFLVTDVFNGNNDDYDGANVDWTELSEIAIPVPPTSNATSWTKAVDFDGSNDYLQQVSGNSIAIPMMLPTDRQINASTILTEGYTSSDGAAKPWASTVTFKWGGGSSVQHVWSMGGNQGQDIHLKINDVGNIYFCWGSGYPDNNEKLIANVSIGEWVSVYVGCAGIRPFPNTDANQTNLNKNFDIRVANANFIANDLDASQLTTPTSYWAGSGKIMYVEIDGQFTVGSSHSGDRFNGTIASLVTTTLKINDQMPQDAEIKKMMLDPMGWVTDYKIGNSYRRPHSSSLYSNFQLNDNSSYTATQVWLMGDGVNDGYGNGIRNQIESTEQNWTKLVFNNMQSNDIQNVTIAGLS